MSMSATQAAPVRTGSVTSAGSGTSATPTDAGTGFGALLAALAPGSGATAVPDSAPAPTPSGVCGAGPEVSVPSEDAVVGAADSSTVVVGAAGDDTTGSRTGDPGTGPVPATTDGTDATASEPAADPVPGVDPAVGAALLVQAQLAALPLLSPTVAVPRVGTGTTGDGETTAVEGGDAAALLGGTEPSVGDLATASSSPASSSTASSPAPQPTLPAAGSAPTPDPAVSGTAGVAVTPTAAPTSATPAARPADAVPGQVFPEVVRLSQSGPGTHRVTLRLDPGTLGEVRVTLTVRDGEVQVRLSAQQDAREVLALAAPDLRRLLEQSGGVEARVTVADLATGTTTDLTGDGPSGRGAGADPDAERPGSYDAPERPEPRRTGSAPESAPAPRADPVRPGLDLAL